MGISAAPRYIRDHQPVRRLGVVLVGTLLAGSVGAALAAPAANAGWIETLGPGVPHQVAPVESHAETSVDFAIVEAATGWGPGVPHQVAPVQNPFE
jgi:hypothetical protein